MPKKYDQDLRDKVIAYLESGHTPHAASKIFNLAANTIRNWYKRYKKGQTIIMDNASFHKSQKIKEVIEQAGCRLIYLPPYSPDLNPIEIFWANMKKWIKYHIPHINNS